MLGLLKRRSAFVGTARATLDRQYSQGTWECLAELPELPRYAVIAQMIEPGKSILDVGCGPGILKDRLRPDYKFYLGFDYSGEAIRKACSDEKTFFAVADATTFETKTRFDVVVLNECLCYFPDAFERYFNFVQPDGVLITSMYTTHREFREIHRRVSIKHCSRKVIDFELRCPSKGHEWTVSLFKAQAGQ